MSASKANISKKGSSQSKKAPKKSNMPLILAAAAVLCLAIVVMFVSKGGNLTGGSPDADESSGTASGAGDVQIIEAGGSLVIPISEISSVATFYPVEIDGTRMEVLAVKDSDGNIRTAFNTCQICYSSGRGYYVQDGNVLVCQNCGNRFTVDQVEIESGGCNPWPIFEENKTVTEDSIEISYDFLSECKALFAHWKTSY